MSDENPNTTDEALPDAADTTLAEDAQDTLSADAGDDTVAGEAGDDTIAADAGDDTVQADAGDDAVQAAAADDAITDAPAPRDEITVAVEPDDTDREFDEAIKEIQNDDMLSAGQKRSEVLKLKVQQEDRTERRRSQAKSRENDARDAAAAEFGVTRAVLDKTWKEACLQAKKETGEENTAVAKYILKQKFAAAKKPAATKAPAKKPAPKVVTTATGARLAPPGGGAQRTVKPAPTAADIFVKGNWAYPADTYPQN